MPTTVPVPPERPLLTAHWTELLMLNFAVPTDVIARVAPPGTEPDEHGGQSYLSVVGFRFQQTRLFGLPIPGHTRFEEINLRYYVRRRVEGAVRRGVVFVQEIVPRRAVALMANWLYNENYIARPMQSTLHLADVHLAPGDSVEYRWRSGRGTRRRWNRLAARVAGPLQPPQPDSLEAFIVESYWGYGRWRDGATSEYRVAHEPWRVAPVEGIAWDCDIVATYRTPLAEFLTEPPVHALIADGSPVQVFRGRTIGDQST